MNDKVNESVPYSNIASKIMLKENISIHNKYIPKSNQCKFSYKIKS